MKKMGHTGTLDPFATGLLVVATGRYTKLIPYLEKAQKSYTATIKLGETSSTHDTEGEITATQNFTMPTQKQIQEVINTQFMGDITQIPPQHSAIKVNGKRAYESARKGEKVEIKPRKTTVHSLEIIDFNAPLMTLSMTVQAGFYVRALARDLGKVLGCGAYCSALRRTKVGDITLEHATTIDNLKPLDATTILTKLPTMNISAARYMDFTNGRAFPMSGADGYEYLVTLDGVTIGLGRMVHGKLQPKIVTV